ncbi:hypothetical protein BDZ45DRAFT_506358 [Acephala macrosclerotiorum]|nr:hypothetical protein BDZ45DRAFT_506358 [Acephala macrosclerotiorum]
MKFIDGLGEAYNSWQQSFNLNHDVTNNGTTLPQVQQLAKVEEQRLARISRNVALTATITSSKILHRHRRRRRLGNTALIVERNSMIRTAVGSFIPNCSKNGNKNMLREPEREERARRRKESSTKTEKSKKTDKKRARSPSITGKGRGVGVKCVFMMSIPV